MADQNASTPSSMAGRSASVATAYSINSSLRASYSYAGTSTLIYIIIMHALHCSGIAALSDGSSLSPEETLTSQRQRRQNAYLSPLLGAISAGHSITQSGLKWALYDFFFFLAFEFSAHGDPLRRDGKRKQNKKADAQMTEISVSADGDSGETKMTETPYQ